MLKKKQKNPNWVRKIPGLSSSNEEILRYAKENYHIGDAIKYKEGETMVTYTIEEEPYHWNSRDRAHISVAGARDGCVMYYEGEWIEVIKKKDE